VTYGGQVSNYRNDVGSSGRLSHGSLTRLCQDKVLWELSRNIKIVEYSGMDWVEIGEKGNFFETLIIS
jgi:hypothetical protein